MKVVAVSVEGCEFCQGFGSAGKSSSKIVVGRYYTVVYSEKLKNPHGLTGVGYLLAEEPLPPGWCWCSCAFREIDGDAEEWRTTIKENRPKTRELEPA